MAHSKTGAPPGRPRSSARVTALRGGKVTYEPVLPAADVKPPEGLSPDAAVFWSAYVDQLPQQLTRIDVPAFTELAELWSTLQRAHRILARDGDLVVGERGSSRSPAHLIIQASIPLWHSLASQFGLTPAGRLKLLTPPPVQDSSDLLTAPFDGRPR